MRSYIIFLKNYKIVKKMKKSILLGILISVFVLMSLPSINAVGLNNLKENPGNLTKIKKNQFLSIVEEIENTDSSAIFFTSSLIFAGIALSILIVVLIYIYCSGMIGGTTEAPPTMSFISDYTQNTITVSSVETNVSWSDMQVDGQCDTSCLSGNIKAGDKITECSGKITIRHKPTGSVVFTDNF